MMARLLQISGALRGWRGWLGFPGAAQRKADTVGNMLDFRRVTRPGPRIASTAVSPQVGAPAEVHRAPGSPAR